MLDVTAILRLLRGHLHRRGKVETCGMKRAFTRRNVLAMDAARRRFIKGTQGTRQASWDLVRAKARVPKASRTTVARAFDREWMGATLRRLRETPQRAPENEQERADLRGKMWHWPLRRFTDGLGRIIENRSSTSPPLRQRVSTRPRRRCTPSYGLARMGLRRHFTKPRMGNHRRTLGGKLHACAGISGDRAVLWEYYKERSGQVAADMYRGPIMADLGGLWQGHHQGLKCPEVHNLRIVGC